MNHALVTRQDIVRIIAYKLWQLDGEQDGLDLVFWTIAERLFEEEERQGRKRKEAEAYG